MVTKSLLRSHWAKWASHYEWDIFGTLNFATGNKSGVEEAQRQWLRFWGKLDRICYGQSKGRQNRVQRFVFTHSGSNGDNIHSHFLARSLGDTREFCVLLNALWAGMEGAGAAIAEQNEILPIFNKQRSSWYLLHEDHDGAMNGFNAKLTHLDQYQPKMRDTALIDLRSAADRFQHISDATTAFTRCDIRHPQLCEPTLQRRLRFRVVTKMCKSTCNKKRTETGNQRFFQRHGSFV